MPHLRKKGGEREKGARGEEGSGLAGRESKGRGNKDRGREERTGRKRTCKEDKTILGNPGNQGVMCMLCSEVGYFTVM